jgi:hypothetical protein
MLWITDFCPVIFRDYGECSKLYSECMVQHRSEPNCNCFLLSNKHNGISQTTTNYEQSDQVVTITGVTEHKVVLQQQP